ncbi:MAG: Ty1/Copia family ribonuclease HI, partial [Cetobacterium sp.]
MILYIHSDASYLSEPKARSRVGGFFYLGNKNEPTNNSHPNGAVHIESRIMKNVMSSAAEAETGALFHNGQEGAHLRNILKELGHEQPGPTVIVTDNSTADGFANQRTRIKRSKANDMRFYWIQDRVRQGQFIVKWSPGIGNLADYFTKHHPATHHIKMRPTYLHIKSTASTASDCKGVLIQGPRFSPGLVPVTNPVPYPPFPTGKPAPIQTKASIQTLLAQRLNPTAFSRPASQSSTLIHRRKLLA